MLNVGYRSTLANPAVGAIMALDSLDSENIDLRIDDACDSTSLRQE
jgi:hypothetical protein